MKIGLILGNRTLVLYIGATKHRPEIGIPKGLSATWRPKDGGEIDLHILGYWTWICLELGKD